MRYLSFTGHLLYYVSTTAELLTHFYLMFYSQRRGFLLSLGNLKVSPKIRRGSIKSIRIKTERRIKNIRSTGTVTRLEVRTRRRRKRKIKMGITILVLNTPRNTMRRLVFNIYVQLLCLYVSSVREF